MLVQNPSHDLSGAICALTNSPGAKDQIEVDHHNLCILHTCAFQRSSRSRQPSEGFAVNPCQSDMYALTCSIFRRKYCRIRPDVGTSFSLVEGEERWDKRGNKGGSNLGR